MTHIQFIVIEAQVHALIFSHSMESKADFWVKFNIWNFPWKEQNYHMKSQAFNTGEYQPLFDFWFTREKVGDT